MIARCIFDDVAQALWLVVAILLLGPVASVAGENDELEHGVDWLRAGHKAKDTKPLERFLAGWHAGVKPVSDEILKKKPAFEREAYAIFQAFFDPSKSYRDRKYIVVQKQLEVILVDDRMAEIASNMGQILDEGEGDTAHTSFPDQRLRALPVISRITLHDFRPQIDVEGPQTLYLNDRHLRCLLEFLIEPDPVDSVRLTPLTQRYWDYLHECVEGYELLSGEQPKRRGRKERLEYLNKVLYIIPGHWGSGWHFETHPYAGKVYLSSDHLRAVVSFRKHYGGGEVYLRKDSQGWRVMLRDENWME